MEPENTTIKVLLQNPHIQYLHGFTFLRQHQDVEVLFLEITLAILVLQQLILKLSQMEFRLLDILTIMARRVHCTLIMLMYAHLVGYV